MTNLHQRFYRDVFVDFQIFKQGWFKNVAPIKCKVLICHLEFSHLVATGQKKQVAKVLDILKNTSVYVVQLSCS